MAQATEKTRLLPNGSTSMPSTAASATTLNNGNERAARIVSYLSVSIAFNLFVRFFVRAAQLSEGGYGVMMANSSDTALQVLTNLRWSLETYTIISLVLGIGDAVGTAFAVGQDANIKKALINGIADYTKVKPSTKKWIGLSVAICLTAYFFGALSPLVGLTSAYKNADGKATDVPFGIWAAASFLALSQFMLYIFMNTTKPKLAGELIESLVSRISCSRKPATDTATDLEAGIVASASTATQEIKPSIDDYLTEANYSELKLGILGSASRGLIFAFSALKFANQILGLDKQSIGTYLLTGGAGLVAILMNMFTTVLYNMELNAIKQYKVRNNIQVAGTTAAAGQESYGWLDSWPKLLAFTKMINSPLAFLSFLSKVVGTGDFLLEVATIKGALDLSNDSDLKSYDALMLVVGGIALGYFASQQWWTQCYNLGEKGAPRTVQMIGEDIYWLGEKAYNGMASCFSNTASCLSSTQQRTMDACCPRITNGDETSRSSLLLGGASLSREESGVQLSARNMTAEAKSIV